MDMLRTPKSALKKLEIMILGSRDCWASERGQSGALGASVAVCSAPTLLCWAELSVILQIRSSVCTFARAVNSYAAIEKVVAEGTPAPDHPDPKNLIKPLMLLDLGEPNLVPSCPETF